MQYAMVDGARTEAKPKLRGTCPNCHAEVVSKCGQKRIWHWSHLGKLECDRWWEPETEWHRAWKALFPQDWQEVVHVAADGERHIADVKNDRGWVIEFQHSPLDPNERLSREDFYGTMVWVVDGLRYKRDLPAFREAVAYGLIFNDSPLYLDIARGAAAMFKRWTPLKRRVFIDFGDEDIRIAGFPLPSSVIWEIISDSRNGRVVTTPVTRDSFIHFYLQGTELQHLTAKRPQQPHWRYRRY